MASAESVELQMCPLISNKMASWINGETKLIQLCFTAYANGNVLIGLSITIITYCQYITDLNATVCSVFSCSYALHDLSFKHV